MEPQESTRPEEAHSDDFRMYEYKVSGRGAPQLFKMPAAGPLGVPPLGPFLSSCDGRNVFSLCCHHMPRFQGAKTFWVMCSGV